MNGWQYKTEFSPQNDTICTNYIEKITNHDVQNQIQRPEDKIDSGLSIMDAVAEPFHHSK